MEATIIHLTSRDTFDCDHVNAKEQLPSEVSVSNSSVHLSYQSMEWLNNYDQVSPSHQTKVTFAPFRFKDSLFHCAFRHFIRLLLNSKQPVDGRCFIFIFFYFFFSTISASEALRQRSINPLRFVFYHPRSTDFEERKQRICEQAKL